MPHDFLDCQSLGVISLIARFRCGRIENWLSVGNSCRCARGDFT